jgi:hypothetical protein
MPIDGRRPGGDLDILCLTTVTVATADVGYFAALLARWLPKSRLGGRRKGTRKGNQVFGPSLCLEIEIYCRQRRVMIRHIAHWYIIARNQITKIKFSAHPKLNTKW